MFIELEKQLGVKLPLQTIFKSPTIKELAAVIENEESNLEWKPVVMFRKGGNKPPLFCLHMHNGNIYRWKVLEKYLPDDQPIYAIQPKALDSKQTPHRNIVEQAAYYLEEVKKIQPHGPYHFVGLCYGGTVAFEMALQLESRNEKPALIFMVNNYAPLENQKLYRMTKGFERFFQMNFSEKMSYALGKNRELGKKIKDKAMGLFSKKTPDTNNPVEQNQEDIRVIHTLALMAYQPVRKLNGNVFIVRVGGTVEDSEFYDETIGWKKWVNGKIEVVQVEGSNNDTIIEEEQYHSQLSGFLKKKLDEIYSAGVIVSRNQ
jgi:thioesterase domain-containing protein